MKKRFILTALFSTTLFMASCTNDDETIIENQSNFDSTTTQSDETVDESIPGNGDDDKDFNKGYDK